MEQKGNHIRIWKMNEFIPGGKAGLPYDEWQLHNNVLNHQRFSSTV
jgi:hypothetical protein